MFISNSSLDAATMTSWPISAPQITTTANLNGSPWFYSALTQVRDIERSGELIPGLGDLRIVEQTAMRARMVLSSIEIENLPSPVISPVSGGGLSITWSLGLKEVKFFLDPAGETWFFKVEDDEVSDDGAIEVLVPNRVTDPLKWMLDS